MCNCMKCYFLPCSRRKLGELPCRQQSQSCDLWCCEQRAPSAPLRSSTDVVTASQTDVHTSTREAACGDGMPSGMGRAAAAPSAAAGGITPAHRRRRCCPAVYLFSGCAALNSANLGIDIGVSSDVGLEVQEFFELSDEKTELFMGSINLFAIAGSLLASVLSDWLGRRRAFAVAAVGFEIGVLTMVLSRSFAVLMAGRALVGLGVGFGFAVDPVYIAEIAPPAMRGRLVTWSEIATNVGILAGFLCGFAFSGVDRAHGWRLMLGMGGVLPLVMLLLVWRVMPESPRWLVQKGKVAEAKAVLATLGVHDTAAAVGAIQHSLQAEDANSRSIGWGSILRPRPALRRMLVVGVGVAICQQLSGIDGIQCASSPPTPPRASSSPPLQHVCICASARVARRTIPAATPPSSARARRCRLFNLHPESVGTARP